MTVTLKVTVTFVNNPLTAAPPRYGIFASMTETILIVEDEPSLQETLAYNLENNPRERGSWVDLVPLSQFPICAAEKFDFGSLSAAR